MNTENGFPYLIPRTEKDKWIPIVVIYDSFPELILSNKPRIPRV